MKLEIIDEDEEARLAFTGALSRLDEPFEGEVGVVDVGGGSTEIVVGSAAGGITGRARSGSAAAACADLFGAPTRRGRSSWSARAA